MVNDIIEGKMLEKIYLKKKGFLKLYSKYKFFKLFRQVFLLSDSRMTTSIDKYKSSCLKVRDRYEKC